MSHFKNTVDLFIKDFPRTLFPLNTNKILIEHAADVIGAFIYQEIGKGKSNFLAQTRAYASKSEHHLRRTFKLDPVAEFFIYDLVYKNRAKFRKSKNIKRQSFGYSFEEGHFLSPSKSYDAYKEHVEECLLRYKYVAKFDIASYFNSIYHHDLVNWFRNIASQEEDTLLFDKFLKQINSGRSVDCLPHGIMPAKIIGSHFLKFIDDSSRIQSDQLVRFMDDFYLFSNTHETLMSDFFKIQRLLGDKALSINSSKTAIGDLSNLGLTKKIDDMKVALLKRRRSFISASGWDEDQEEDKDTDEKSALKKKEITYLFSLLEQETIEEADAELVLSLMRDNTEDVLEYIPTFLKQFPNLTKNIFYFCERVEDTNGLSDIIYNFIKGAVHITEYQLFWLGKLAEERLDGTTKYGEIIISLYEHENATTLSQAKILEIPEKRFGMPDLREENLRAGSSDWLAWSAAVGTRKEKKGSRNHLLKYFSNGSPMNKLISECIVKM